MSVPVSVPAALTLIQVGAVLGGSAGVAFFALFGGYYYRNRRLALRGRDALGGRPPASAPHTAEATTRPDAGDADDIVHSTG